MPWPACPASTWTAHSMIGSIRSWNVYTKLNPSFREWIFRRGIKSTVECCRPTARFGYFCQTAIATISVPPSKSVQRHCDTMYADSRTELRKQKRFQRPVYHYYICSAIVISALCGCGHILTPVFVSRLCRSKVGWT